MDWLRIEDLARILGQERLRRQLIDDGVPENTITPEMLKDAPPLKVRSIHQYVLMARRVKRGDPNVRRQYRNHPFPLPSNDDDATRGNYVPVWAPAAEQEEEIRAWYRARPGPGRTEDPVDTDEEEL